VCSSPSWRSPIPDTPIGEDTRIGTPMIDPITVEPTGGPIGIGGGDSQSPESRAVTSAQSPLALPSQALSLMLRLPVSVIQKAGARTPSPACRSWAGRNLRQSTEPPGLSAPPLTSHLPVLTDAGGGLVCPSKEPVWRSLDTTQFARTQGSPRGRLVTRSRGAFRSHPSSNEPPGSGSRLGGQIGRPDKGSLRDLDPLGPAAEARGLRLIPPGIAVCAKGPAGRTPGHGPILPHDQASVNTIEAESGRSSASTGPGTSILAARHCE
jgi:hypothetical protein